MEDAEESAAGPEAMAAAEAAREAGRRARNQGRRNFGARSMEALVEDMIEQAYAGDGLEVCHALASLLNISFQWPACWISALNSKQHIQLDHFPSSRLRPVLIGTFFESRQQSSTALAPMTALSIRAFMAPTAWLAGFGFRFSQSIFEHG